MIAILMIDTSGPGGLVALATDGRLTAIRRNEGERDHAGAINRMMAEVLAEGGITAAGLKAVAVCSGPGSYTGLRIGMATAKGLCYALNIPLICHNRLALLIGGARVQFPAADRYAALLPARAGEYFASVAGAPEHILVAPGHFTTQQVYQIFSKFGGQSWAVAGALEADLSVLSQEFPVSYTNSVHHDMDVWIKYTFDSWENNTFSDLALSEPDYLKPVYIASPR